MADVFDEVEEELRKERYTQLFRTYGPWVIGAAVAVVAGVAGYQWWDARVSGAQAASGEQMYAAVEAYQSGEYERAGAQLDTLASQAPRGYETLAQLQQGAIALEQGNEAEALAFYNEAASIAPDRLTRDVARYKALLIEMDELSYDDVALRAEALTQGEAPLGPLARELTGIAAIRAERWEEARRIYDQLAFALDTPQNMQRRIAEARALIAQNAPAEPAASVPSGEGAGETPQEEGN